MSALESGLQRERGRSPLRSALVAGAVVLLCTLTACTGSDSDEAAVVIDITIRDGKVSPAGEQVEVTVGKPIEIHVNSDVAEELHLHTTPDQSFDVKPIAGQVFTSTVNQPGQVELEPEQAGVLVAQLVARP